MTADEILAGLTRIFRDVFDDDSLTLRAETSAKDIAGWDSVKMVKLILAVEERMAIRMRNREIDALTCVGDWVTLIESKL